MSVIALGALGLLGLVAGVAALAATLQGKSWAHAFAAQVAQVAPAHGVLHPASWAAVVAHAAHESGWNRSRLSRLYFNYWGIKWAKWMPVGYAELETTEYVGGAPVRVRARFAAFSSPLEALHFYFNFLKRNFPKALEALRRGDPEGLFKALARGGWATDPRYSSRLIAVYRSLPKEVWNV